MRMLLFGFVVVYSLARRGACLVLLRVSLAAMAVLRWVLMANLTGEQMGVIQLRLVSRGTHANAQIKVGT